MGEYFTEQPDPRIVSTVARWIRTNLWEPRHGQDRPDTPIEYAYVLLGASRIGWRPIAEESRKRSIEQFTALTQEYLTRTWINAHVSDLCQARITSETDDKAGCDITLHRVDIPDVIIGGIDVKVSPAGVDRAALKVNPTLDMVVLPLNVDPKGLGTLDVVSELRQGNIPDMTEILWHHLLQPGRRIGINTKLIVALEMRERLFLIDRLGPAEAEVALQEPTSFTNVMRTLLERHNFWYETSLRARKREQPRGLITDQKPDTSKSDAAAAPSAFLEESVREHLKHLEDVDAKRAERLRRIIEEMDREQST